MRSRKQQQAEYHLRPIDPNHLLQIVQIERQTFLHPWSGKEFCSTLATKKSINVVACDSRSRVIGYLFCDVRREYAEILNLAVECNWNRRGVGTEMVQHLRRRLVGRQPETICAAVWEGNLSAHLFLKSQRFIATEVLPRHFEVNGEVAYLFECDVSEGRTLLTDFQQCKDRQGAE